jgi:hypothetical protein
VGGCNKHVEFKRRRAIRCKGAIGRVKFIDPLP